MFYQISNIANRRAIESVLSAKFKYPDIYTPKMTIDGTVENVLPILTSGDRDYIHFAIWGLFAETFSTDFKSFYSKKHALNIKTTTLKKHLEFYKTTKVNRCLIPLTGYVDFKNEDGEITTHSVNHSKTTPFCVAGVYNQLSDGFFTCSLLLNERDPNNSKTLAVSAYQPAVIHSNRHADWLNPKVNTLDALKMLQEPHDYTLNEEPTSNHLFLNTCNDNLEDVLGLEDAV